MSDLIDNIIAVSWLMLTFGWVIHTLALMRHVEKKRERPTSLIWFIRNRQRKFISMVITPIPLGLIEYVVVHPPTLDLTTLQGRALLGGYLMAILLTGAGSNKVIDRFGSGYSLERIEKDYDNYGTRVVPITDKQPKDYPDE